LHSISGEISESKAQNMVNYYFFVGSEFGLFDFSFEIFSHYNTIAKH